MSEEFKPATDLADIWGKDVRRMCEDIYLLLDQIDCKVDFEIEHVCVGDYDIGEQDYEPVFTRDADRSTRVSDELLRYARAIHIVNMNSQYEMFPALALIRLRNCWDGVEELGNAMSVCLTHLDFLEAWAAAIGKTVPTWNDKIWPGKAGAIPTEDEIRIVDEIERKLGSAASRVSIKAKFKDHDPDLTMSDHKIGAIRRYLQDQNGQSNDE